MNKLLQFLQEHNGDFSSKRLFAFSIVVSTIIDYQHAIWTIGSWHPDLGVIGLTLGSIGAVAAGKLAESKESDNAT